MGTQYPMKLIRHQTQPRVDVQHEWLGLPPWPPPKNQVQAIRTVNPCTKPIRAFPREPRRCLGAPKKPPTMNYISILTWLREVQAIVGQHFRRGAGKHRGAKPAWVIGS